MTNHIYFYTKDIAQRLSIQLSGAVSADELCALSGVSHREHDTPGYYNVRSLMLDHCVLTLEGEAASCARQLRALDLLQQKRLDGGESDAAQLILDAATLTILHTIPALITPAHLASLAPIEREAVLALRDLRASLSTLCERLDLAPARLRDAHAHAIRKLARAS